MQSPTVIDAASGLRVFFCLGCTGNLRSARRVEPACGRLIAIAFFQPADADTGAYEGRCSMSQALPARPNLDWLRKTAKQELHQLRKTNPDAKLAGAQLALARQYGFRSWRAMKAEVDRLQALGSSSDQAIKA